MDLDDTHLPLRQKQQLRNRHIFIKRAHIEYLRCLDQTNWRHDRAGESVWQLLHQLYALASSSIYEEVRQMAQRSLHNAWRLRPFAPHAFLSGTIAKLGDPRVGEDELKGTISLLLGHRALRLISRDWRYLGPFLVGIASAHVHSDEKLQALLYRLFVAFAVSVYPAPLALPPPRPLPAGLPATAQPSSDVLARAAQDAALHNTRNRESYDNGIQHSFSSLSQ